MNPVALGETPLGPEVPAEVVHFFDGGQKSGVDGLTTGNGVVISCHISLLQMSRFFSKHTFCSFFFSSDTVFFSAPSPKNSPSLEEAPAALERVK